MPEWLEYFDFTELTINLLEKMLSLKSKAEKR